MTLFHWWSSALQRYGNGHVLVAAETVEEARAKVMDAAGPAWLHTKHLDAWVLQLTTEDDVEEYRAWRAKLVTDLAKEPDTDPVQFISGSE